MQPTDNDSHFGGARVTEQRRKIAAAADGMPGAFTVDDLVGVVRRDSPAMGTATVYRAVAAMEHAGSVERVGSRGGSVLYVRCDAGTHHHHLVCTACGAVAPARCPLDAAGAARAIPGGFVVTSHELTLYGLCAECAPEPPGIEDVVSRSARSRQPGNAHATCCPRRKD